ncbi:M108R [Myxoma virus]|nr:m108R [Myxoma virus]WLM68562.1 M108R [Myxoma virus]WNN26989.1 M108R [Myxoma virus]
MSVCSEIDYALYTELKKFLNSQPLFLFNADKNFVEVVPSSSFKFYIPIGVFSNSDVALIRPVHTTCTNHIESADATFPNLYPLQKRVVTEVTTSMRQKLSTHRPMYMTLHLSCGFGKTITACYLMVVHRRKTVICVPNKMLIHQWKAAVELTKLSYIISTDGVSVLLKQLRTKTADVLIIVSRHLSNDYFCKKIHDEYDTFILDESHMYNLMNNSALTKFLTFYPPRICYFLTATPRLANRIYCNDVVNVLKVSTLMKRLKIVEYFFEPYSTECIRQMAKHLNTENNKYHIYTEKILAEDLPRNNLIVDTVSTEFKNNLIERVIVVVKLRKHMAFFYEKFVEEFGTEYVYLGDAKNKDTSAVVKSLLQKKKFIFVSTSHYSGTGLDIPSLDSLVICCAVLNSMQIEQLLGRVCRESESVKKTVFLFPNTSVREIKHSLGFFTERIVSISTDKLGFEQEGKEGTKEEPALTKAFSLQTR